jgi:flagellar hook-associated protein 2
MTFYKGGVQMSNNLRITGLASGLDVDSMVKQMMKVHTMKVDKFKQDRQLVQWKQDLFREVIGDFNSFKSTYFDVLKSDTYMLSSRNYSSFTVATSDNNATLSATATAGATAGNYKVTVSQLADKARVTGTNSEINVERALNDLSFPAEINSANKVLNFEFGDGINHAIILEEGNNFTMQDLAAKINSKLSTATNGDISNKVVASTDGKTIKFTGMIEITDTNKTINIVDTNDGNKQHTITLSTGKFSLDSLKNSINLALKSAKDSGGASVDLSSKVSVAVSLDGSKLDIVNAGTNNIAMNGSSASILDTSLKVKDPTLTQMGNNIFELERKIVAGVNDNLSVKINGKQYNLTLATGTYGKPTGGSTDAQVRTDLVSKLKAALTSAKEALAPTTTVDLTATEKLDASLSLDGTRIQLVSKTNKTINISGNVATTLGFSTSFDINQSVDDKVSTLFDGTDGKVHFVINDGTKNVEFRYNFNSSTDETTGTAPNQITFIGAKDMTISALINDISSKTNVKMSYSQLTRKFTIESNETGSSQGISVTMPSTSDGTDGTSSGFLSTLFGAHDTSGDGLFDMLSDQGEDAIVSITDPNNATSQVIKSTNSFAIDGISYSLYAADPGKEKIVTLTPNPQKTFDNIKSLVDKYNEIIDKVNKRLSEKRVYSYKPLTDDQKKDMNEDDIKRWEEKTKEGLLKNDSSLDNMLISMRNAFYNKVEGVSLSLSDIGLSTSSDISARGKIIIDEAKLRDAITNKGDQVSALFTKQSTKVSSYNPNLTETQRRDRNSDEGIFQRINDILQDGLRTTRDSKGKKGYLLEKAGIKGDYSEYHNLLTQDLDRKDKVITELTSKLADKENKYYIQFSKLETAMQKMNSQSSWLSQQLGSMS